MHSYGHSRQFAGQTEETIQAGRDIFATTGIEGAFGTMPINHSLQASRIQPCFCDSGQRFQNCCGSRAPDRKAPHGIVVIEDYLSQQECNDLQTLAESLERERLTVVDLDKTTDTKIVRKLDDRRVTERVTLAEHQARFNAIAKSVYLDTVQPSIEDQVLWFEEPQLLRYTPGSFYAGHSDSDSYFPEKDDWERVMDRDISLLLYLSNDFEGGCIYFDNFDYRVKPKAGTLVYFPSDNRYMHTAEEVTGGVRYAIVSWSSLVGVDKVRSGAPEHAIMLTSPA
jgi:predicted 2-oxoglutarate/Fe(II)-dependent dioxygenase YbiX